jgi:hypothetical protein
MQASFLLPGTHDQLTGGNIYNRRIITELRGRYPVEAVSWTPAPDRQGLEGADPSIVVVDSLLLRSPGPLRALREVVPSATIVLLAHYLHCIDPGKRATAAAATERALLSLFDGAVTTSPYARQALVAEGMPPDTVSAVPPGLDAAYRRPPSPPNRTGPPTLLTVANVLPGKGLLDLIEQLDALDDLAWRWTLVGNDTLDPDFARTVAERVEASTVADRLTHVGTVPAAEMPAQYDRADLFVLPSHFETCSMATREAMARGRPVVGYAVGGLPDNFGEDPAGHLVPPDRPDALGAALRTLLTAPATRRRMGGAARRRSKSFPSWPDAATRFWAALQSI